MRYNFHGAFCDRYQQYFNFCSIKDHHFSSNDAMILPMPYSTDTYLCGFVFVNTTQIWKLQHAGKSASDATMLWLQSGQNWPNDQSGQNWPNGASLKVKWERYLTGDAREGIKSQWARLIMMVKTLVNAGQTREIWQETFSQIQTKTQIQIQTDNK